MAIAASPSVAEIERQLVVALGARPEVQDAYLFGSHASGRAQAHSDIDVAVWIDAEPPGIGQFGYSAELTAHLIAALGTNEVDVVLLNKAPPLLYHRVLRDGRRLLSRNPGATAAREGYAFSRYCDYVPQLAKIEATRRAAARRIP